MPPRDHGFRAPRYDSAPNRNFFRFTVVNCATHRVTQHGVSFLQFEELLTAKARKIGVKFNSKTPIGGSDFLRRGFGRQAKRVVCPASRCAPRTTINAALTARSSVTSVANPADELPTFNTLWLARTKTSSALLETSIPTHCWNFMPAFRFNSLTQADSCLRDAGSGAPGNCSSSNAWSVAARC